MKPIEVKIWHLFVFSLVAGMFISFYLLPWLGMDSITIPEVARAAQAASVTKVEFTEPQFIEFYTSNPAFFEADVRVTNWKGINITGPLYLDSKSGWHKLRMASPGDLSKGYHVTIWYADGRGYSVFTTDKIPAHDYDSTIPIYLVITTCIGGGIPKMYVNFAANGEGVWPVNYKGPTDCKF